MFNQLPFKKYSLKVEMYKRGRNEKNVQFWYQRVNCVAGSFIRTLLRAN